MARAAEAAGFDSIWLGDHLLYRDDGREERGPWDAWSLLAALATSTARVRLGPLVACTAFAPPGLLARKAAAIQEISGGRFVLGLGAGWHQTEFHAFGLPFDHRATRFGESFEIIRRLLAGERVTFDGRFEHVRDAVLLPRPDVAPPLLVGSTGERVLRAALPHVAAWNIWYDWFGNTPAGFASENERVTRLVREVGTPPLRCPPHRHGARRVGGRPTGSTAHAGRSGPLRPTGGDRRRPPRVRRGRGPGGDPRRQPADGAVDPYAGPDRRRARRVTTAWRRRLVPQRRESRCSNPSVSTTTRASAPSVKANGDSYVGATGVPRWYPTVKPMMP